MIKWAYILIGDDYTGKTTFQKELIRFVAFNRYQHLDCNLTFDIRIRIGNNNIKTISLMNRSFQEKEYQSVPDFFSSHFKEADACILSSHLVQPDIEQMIGELKKRFYNVCGVFFENSVNANKPANEVIALLDWDEKYWIENPITGDEKSWRDIIQNGAMEFGNHLLCKI
ncbi:hypothetical protein TREPR_3855 [Treponema primitia ZAS-2]|uniref:Uncharacterized protein n=2 Tax=Treponema primitia TaxID=88058 RepID=F5YP39_TREPZ|nr:hypothetical protein TREPR_3855 [Treponema primitia ZAS-2]